MKLPASLAKYSSSSSELDAAADDAALVKLGTVKKWIARTLKLIPVAGPGFYIRRSQDGDVWTLTAEAKPFQISSSGVIHPGVVGGRMPTYGGVRLDEGPSPLDMSGSFIVWFKMTFSVTYNNGFLGAYSLTSVVVETGSSLPSDTDTVKYLQLNTITNGVPEPSYFSASFDVVLYDNGANATGLHFTPL